MSRLVERLQQAARQPSPPIGFGAARTVRSTARPALVALIGHASEEPGDLTAADGVLISTVKEESVLKAALKGLLKNGQLAWGTSIDEFDEDMMKWLLAAGPDFISFSAASRVALVPEDDKVGKMLEVESAMDDSLLRSINYLPVDAVFVKENPLPGELSWYHIMIFQHLANIISKPLLAFVPVDIPERELKALWEAGVDGLVVGAAPGAEKMLQELRRAIDSLPPRSRPKTGKVEAVLPRPVGHGPRITPVPDEEEEEE